jgi:Protein of unknown function (DUF1501)
MTQRDALGCAAFENMQRMSRRDLLWAGAAVGLGLSLPDVFRAHAQAAASRSTTLGRARSVIILYLHGGHAQQETWDPKPEGPLPARGEFGAIATSVPGIRIGELLPRSAQIMHRLSLIRSLSHGNANHVQAALPAMTGHVHPPGFEARGDTPPAPMDFPPFGAVLNQLRRPGPLPTWVQVGPVMRRFNGTVLHGQAPGFLGARNGPLVVDQPLTPDQVRVDAVSPQEDISPLRLSGRRQLLEQVDAQRRRLDQAAEVQAFDAFQQRALNLLTSSATARAFELAAEAPSLRDRYGRTDFGQGCLLARRLAEAGVPLINVHFCKTPAGSWDTHGRHFSQMKDHLCPIFDQAFSALVTDLAQRGLLEQTLVLPTAEFGRTPTINRSGGRDHWPFVYSVALAGGGTRPGTVYGASDNLAAAPTAHPHHPRDLAATVYHLLGVPEDTILYDQLNRPHALVVGQKIDALLA